MLKLSILLERHAVASASLPLTLENIKSLQ